MGLIRLGKFVDYPTNDEIIEALEGLLDGVRLGYDGKFFKSNVWSSSDSYFEFSSWKTKPNLKKNIVLFIHNRTYYEARLAFEAKHKGKSDGLDNYKEISKIEEEWVKSRDKRFVKEVKFSISEI